LFELYALGILAVLFYFAIGIGTSLKYSAEMSIGLILKFIFILPFQTIKVAATSFAEIVYELFSEEKSENSSVINLIENDLIYFFTSLKICFEVLPVFSSIFAAASIQDLAGFQDSTTIQRKKVAKNRCFQVAKTAICAAFA
jgi:hypothetical protein